MFLVQSSWNGSHTSCVGPGVGAIHSRYLLHRDDSPTSTGETMQKPSMVSGAVAQPSDLAPKFMGGSLWVLGDSWHENLAKYPKHSIQLTNSTKNSLFGSPANISGV